MIYIKGGIKYSNQIIGFTFKEERHSHNKFKQWFAAYSSKESKT